MSNCLHAMTHRRYVMAETVQDVNENSSLVMDGRDCLVLGHSHRSGARQQDRLIGYLLRCWLLLSNRSGGDTASCGSLVTLLFSVCTHFSVGLHSSSAHVHTPLIRPRVTKTQTALDCRAHRQGFESYLCERRETLSLFDFCFFLASLFNYS